MKEEILLKQAHAWFLEITFMQTLVMCVYDTGFTAFQFLYTAPDIDKVDRRAWP